MAIRGFALCALFALSMTFVRARGSDLNLVQSEPVKRDTNCEHGLERDRAHGVYNRADLLGTPRVSLPTFMQMASDQVLWGPVLVQHQTLVLRDENAPIVGQNQSSFILRAPYHQAKRNMPLFGLVINGYYYVVELSYAIEGGKVLRFAPLYRFDPKQDLHFDHPQVKSGRFTAQLVAKYHVNQSPFGQSGSIVAIDEHVDDVGELIGYEMRGTWKITDDFFIAEIRTPHDPFPKVPR